MRSHRVFLLIHVNCNDISKRLCSFALELVLRGCYEKSFFELDLLQKEL